MILRNKLMLSLGICVLGILIYSNTMQSPFSFDDSQDIVYNFSIRDIRNIHGIWAFRPHPTRFIGYYSFAVNYYLHRLDVWGYHLVNLVVHIANAFLLFWFFSMILRVVDNEENDSSWHARHVPWVAAALFLTHPIQTQAVTYIVQRLTSLATLFYLLSLCFYVKGRIGARSAQGKVICWTLSTASAVVGMLTKEITFTLPFVILLTEFLLVRGHIREKKGNLWGCWGLGIMLCGLILMIPILFSLDVRGVLSFQFPSGSHQGDMVTAPRYFVTQWRVIITYLRLMVLPLRQNLDYDYPLISWSTAASAVLSLIIIFLVLAFAFRIAKRHRIMAFGIFWFFITLSVESSIIPIPHVIFEHRLYLPSIGFIIAMSAGCLGWIDSAGPRRAVILIILLTFSFLTYNRNGVWQDRIFLWKDAALKSPRKARPYNNLGVAYFNHGWNDLAGESYEKALAIDQNYYFATLNKADMYHSLADYDKALELYKNTLVLVSDQPDIYHRMGNIYLDKGDYPQAIEMFSKALEWDPHYFLAYFKRGLSFIDTGVYAKAVEDFTSAIKIDPGHCLSYNNRANAYIRMKKFDLAMKDLDKANLLDPKHLNVYFQRAFIFKNLNDFENAKIEYNKILRIDPQNTEAERLKEKVLTDDGEF